MLQQWRKAWLFNVRGDVLAGITATLALIPDSIAFSFIAGVNPMVGIYSAICLLIILSLFGARPAMLSSSAGSMAVLMTVLVAKQGLEYLFAVTVLTGIIQLLMGVFKMGRWMNFVPHAVITGFINALAILIFIAQLDNFTGESWVMYAVVAGTLAIIYIWPRLNKKIPSPLIAVAVMTAVVLLFGLHMRTVGDVATIIPKLPTLHWPSVPLNLHTLSIIFPAAFSLAIVGYCETLLTQSLIDEVTEEKTSKDKELRGQGIANFVTGLFGGMAGCALVAESVINTKMGGRGRLSNLTAGVVLLLLVLAFGKEVSVIPMAALVGVMFMVCYEIFDWRSLRAMASIPISETAVMVVTTVLSVLTHNLALGVLAGVLLSSFIFMYHAAKIQITTVINGTSITYEVQGQLFFGSTIDLHQAIDLTDDSVYVTIDLTRATVWDHSARTALSKIREQLENRGKRVHVQQQE